MCRSLTEFTPSCRLLAPDENEGFEMTLRPLTGASFFFRRAARLWRRCTRTHRPPPASRPMTTPDVTSDPIVPPVKSTPLWEDFIDIWYAPSSVFERRRNANPWPMILIITFLVTIIGVLTFNSLAPVYETELRSMAAAQMAKNPQAASAPQSALDTGITVQMFVRRWGGIFTPIGVLIMALPVWLLGRIVGAKELNYTRSLVVVAWGMIIAVASMLVLGVQGLVMDVSSITTADKLSASAARFADKASMSPWLYGALKTLDVFGLWSLIVMAIGVGVTGRGGKNTAIAFGVVWFVIAILLTAAFTARAA
jgi:hypothetical protein